LKGALRVLLVEDYEPDARLLVRELERGGYEVWSHRVQTAADLRSALAGQSWDVAFCDHTMPGFGGMAGLRILRETASDLPVIIVSGTTDEKTAAQALKSGARDFLVKGDLSRLVHAVQRQLKAVESGRAEQTVDRQVRSLEQRLRLIMETVHDAVIVIDRQNRVVDWNSAAASLIGAEILENARSADSKAQSIFGSDSAAGAQACDAALQRILRGEPVNALELSVCWETSSPAIRISVNARPLYDDSGQLENVVLVLQDVTEAVKTREQLMISDRMASLGLLSAGVAHEINNPLAAVLANVELALREVSVRAGERSDAEWLQALLAELQDADEAGKRIREIVWDLKLFSRVSQSEELASIDVNRVLDSCIRMAHNEIRYRAKLVRNYSTVPFVRANEAKLGQVFLNLLINAAQAIDEFGARENEIRVSTTVAADGRVVVEVRDTGCGMTKEVMGRLFNAFFTTKPAGVGTGLGLSISNRIVAALGGEITIESAVGKGSAFRVHLPPGERRRSEAPGSKAESAKPPRRGRIMVIDEEPKVVTVLCRCLSPDHEVFVSRAADAVESIRRGAEFDVILCGLMMSQTTGMDVYERLSRNAPEQARKMVFMTGGAFTPRAMTFLDTIDNPYIEKPFDLDALRALVNERLG